MATVGLSYDDNGAGADPAFMFIHGWTCNRSFFAPQYQHFARSHRAVAVDLRGHGDSPVASDGDYSIESFASDVACLIDGLAIGPCVVVGHSLGGVITCALAAARPDLVACAVMVDPAPFIPRASLRDFFASAFAAIGAPGGESARAEMVDAMFLPSDDPTRRAKITGAMAKTPQAIAGPAIASLNTFDGRSAFAAVGCPVAAINAQTAYNDMAAMRKINARFVAGQTIGSGHFNQLEVPDQVTAMIDQFVRIST